MGEGRGGDWTLDHRHETSQRMSLWLAFALEYLSNGIVWMEGGMRGSRVDLAKLKIS